MDCSDEIRSLLNDEIFILASPVLTYNKYGWRNSRLLVLTQESLLLIKKRSKKKEVRLRTGYDEMLGLTISLNGASNELVCHYQMQSDRRFKCKGT